MRQAPTASSYMALLSAASIWGTSFLLMKIAVTEAGPFFLAGIRIWIGCATLAILAMILGKSIPKQRVFWLWSIAAGFFSIVLPFNLLAWASLHLPSGVVGVYMAVIPLLLLPLAHILSPVLGLNEYITVAKALGFVIGVIGVFAIFGLETLARLGRADIVAQLACLGAALSYAIGSILVRATPQTEPVGMALLQLFMASLIALPLALPALPQTALSWEVWAALIGIGIGATGVCIVLRVYVISTAGPVFMANSGYLIPVTALFVGWIVLDETFSPYELAGTALILIGVTISRMRLPFQKSTPLEKL